MTNQPPKHLSREAKTLYREVTDRYNFAPHQLKLLVAACEAWDLSREARRSIEEDGLAVPGGRYGTRANPAAQIYRDNIRNTREIFRELNLELEINDDDDEISPVAYIGGARR